MTSSSSFRPKFRAGVVLLAAALLMSPALSPAQGTGATRQDRNKARPVFEDARETTTVSTTALYSWAARLLDGVERPAAIYYGNAEFGPQELLEGQRPQLEAATVFVVYGGEGDGWLAAKFEEVNRNRGNLIRLAKEEEPFFRGHRWLDPVAAKGSMTLLAEELKRFHRNREAVIDKNLAALLSEVEAFDGWAREQLLPFTGMSVYLDRPGLEPLVERYGLKVAGYLNPSISRAADAADVERLTKEIRKAEGPVVILRRPGTLPLPLLRLSQLHPIRFIMVDPIESGETAPGHYLAQMRQNVVTLVLGLTAAKSFPPSFTPVAEKDLTLDGADPESLDAEEE